MKISKIHLNNLRNDAHFQLQTEFRDLVMKHGALALKIKPQFDAYLPLYDRVDEALKKIVKSEFTAKIHEADNRHHRHAEPANGQTEGTQNV